MTNKEFAEKNVGKYFLCEGVKVRVVGYSVTSGVQILVSVQRRARDFGWGADALDDADALVIRSKASKHWCVQ